MIVNSIFSTVETTQNLLLSVWGKRMTLDAARPLRSCHRHCL